jgi:hypothetical protein
MLVMHFMGPPDSAYIGVIRPGKPLEPLMDDYIMHNKISKTISHYAKADGLQPVNGIDRSKKDGAKTRHRKNYKKSIVLLKETTPFSMMVFM